MIPHAIKSFCKCLYQEAKLKFADCTFNELVQLVGHFLLDKWLLSSAFVNLCSEGLTYEYFMPANTLQNFELMYKILSETMTFQRSSDKTLLKIYTAPELIEKIESAALRVFTEVLQLDSHKNSKHHQQELAQVTDVGSKLGWYTVMLTMRQIKMLVEFFKTNPTQKQSVEKIVYFDQEQAILTEKQTKEYDLDNYLTSGSQIVQPDRVDYIVTYLFVKKPQMPKIQVQAILPEALQKVEDETEKQAQANLKELLIDSRNICQYRPLVTDLNNFTGVMKCLIQQIECN